VEDELKSGTNFFNTIINAFLFVEKEAVILIVLYHGSVEKII